MIHLRSAARASICLIAVLAVSRSSFVIAQDALALLVSQLPTNDSATIDASVGRLRRSKPGAETNEAGEEGSKLTVTQDLEINTDVSDPLDPKLVAELSASLGSKNDDERTAALASLAKLVAEKRDGLEDLKPVVEPLFMLSGWGGPARKNARTAEDLIVRIGSAASPLLIQRLKSTEAHDRRVAAELLTRICPPDASLVSLLQPLLSDSDGFVRKAAIEGLGVVGTPAKEAVDDLEQVAINDPILPRRVGACIALIHVTGASEERVRALAAFLELTEPCDGAAAFAASALGDLGPKARVAEAQLLIAVKHVDNQVRVNSAAALGQVGANSPESVTALIELLRNDPEREVRRSAAGALGAIGPQAKAAVPALSVALKGDGKGGWWVVADALARIGGEEVVPVLVEALANPDEGIRCTAMKGLGNIGTLARPAVAALEKSRQQDPRESNRAVAAEALRKIEQAVQKEKLDGQKK